MMKYSLGALVAAGVLAGGFATSASAADLGGNCCADLEERIAELEATTARKGNRKVSLTVSGWVGQQVTWWDDGGESNVYVTDLGTTLASHVMFTGQAQIMPGWTAGYVLHLEAMGSDSLTTSQAVADGPSVLTISGGGATNSVGTLQSFWFIKSDQLGKVSVGKQSQASDNTAILVDGSGSLVPANWVPFDFFSFFVRQKNGQLTNLSWAGAGTWGDVNGLPTNSVRYDSPTFAGFSVSASWGEDDFWDVAARYAGEWNSVKVSVAAAYSQTSNNQDTNAFFPTGNTLQARDTGYFQIGAYVEHVPTGLFAYGAYGHLDNFADAAAGPKNNDTWYGKLGIRKRWNPLGHTVFYGEYEHVENRNGGTIFANGADTEEDDPLFAYGKSSARLWGLGVVQEIDAAAMSLWLKYRNIDASFKGVEAIDAEGGLSTDNFQEVTFGALINF
jgi:predicted porin